MKQQILLPIYTLLVIIFPSFLMAQSSEGTDFWLAFMEHRNVNANTKMVMITSKENTSGTVSMPGKGWATNFEVNANEVKLIQLPGYAETIGSEKYDNTGIHVTAQHTVSVYAHQFANLRSEAALILPTPSLGKEYLVMSYYGFDGVNGGEWYPSEFIIIGVEDETQLTITPTDQTYGGKTAGTPFTITLDQGETYQVQARQGLLGDLTGTEVIGDKNFAIFGGVRWTQVPRNCMAMDNLYEQMYPVDTWGKSFITVPSEGVANDIFRIMASEDNTTIYQDGNVYTTLDRGEFVEKQISGVATSIKADKPILVAKFNTGNSCNGMNTGNGDPSMVFLNSVEQTKDSITLYSSAFENIALNYIDIVVRSDDTSSVYVDGNKVSGSSFEVVAGNTDYAFAQLRVGAGTHNLHNTGCGMIATAYGYGRYESYSYSGGANFKKINLNPIPEGGCLNDTLFFTTGLPLGKAMAEWDFGDGFYSNQLEPAHIYTELGKYQVRLVVFDLCLKTTDTIYQDLLITLRDTVMGGDDFEVCTGIPVQLS
ncbi:MAG: PKD domain-containing protein, partial [Bacteroidetes bacterium]|nr:PKD domain-containing protein [Bacteroidota bacterium]